MEESADHALCSSRNFRVAERQNSMECMMEAKFQEQEHSRIYEYSQIYFMRDRRNAA